MPPPNRFNFFCFCIHFHRKVYVPEVGAPPMGQCPLMGNPGSATDRAITFESLDIEIPFLYILVHLDNIYVKFEYKGHWVKVKVTLIKWALWTVGHQILLLCPLYCYIILVKNRSMNINEACHCT